jgi:hypothetical protein
MYKTDGAQYQKNYVMVIRNVPCNIQTTQVDLSVKPVILSEEGVVVELFIHDIPGHKMYGNFLPEYVTV